VQQRFQTEGADVDHVSQAEFGKFIATETTKWGKIIKEANIKPE
jgi:tripartite-type tricarboxylate transporter receptor subunit TctC